MDVPAKERLYQQEHQQEKHLTAKAAPAIATRDFKQQLERGLRLAEKEEAVPAGEGCTSKRKVVPARETLNSKGGTSNSKQRLQTATRERPVAG